MARCLRPLRPLLTPNGRDGWSDRLVLGIWDGYARLRGRSRPGGGATRPAWRLNLGHPPVPAGRLCDPGWYRDHIRDQLLPFWARFAVDQRHGGFVTHLDRVGRAAADHPKSTAMQARMVYGFSVGCGLSDKPALRELAEHGFRFLADRMWDSQRDGWVTRVSPAGEVQVPDKCLFTQAYVLIGLAEYIGATGDPQARELALRTFESLLSRAWDPVHGGYVRLCAPDWSVTDPAKTLCVHLDMWAAALALHRVLADDRFLRQARCLADLVLTRMYDPRSGFLLEQFTRDWVYDPVATRDRVQIGHNLKAAWLALLLYEQTGTASDMEAARLLLDQCLRTGWDDRFGGFYQHLFRNGILASPVKEWWPNCEGLQALSLMARLGGDPRDRDRFEQLAAFVFASFWDPEHGEWVTACLPDGGVQDARKGGDWKAAYHTVQACTESARNLSATPETTP